MIELCEVSEVSRSEYFGHLHACYCKLPEREINLIKEQFATLGDGDSRRLADVTIWIGGYEWYVNSIGPAGENIAELIRIDYPYFVSQINRA